MPKQNLQIRIDGMHCGGCVTRVTAALKKIEGVEIESVEVGSAAVTYDQSRAGREEIVDAVNKIGFTAREA